MKSSLTKLFIGFVFIVFACSGQFVSAEINLKNDLPVVVDDDGGVTKASFEKMKIGMTRREVNQLIGFSGTELTKSVGGGKVFSAYKWEGKNSAIITAVFEDDVLTHKYSANLK